MEQEIDQSNQGHFKLSTIQTDLRMTGIIWRFFHRSDFSVDLIDQKKSGFKGEENLSELSMSPVEVFPDYKKQTGFRYDLLSEDSPALGINIKLSKNQLPTDFEQTVNEFNFYLIALILFMFGFTLNHRWLFVLALPLCLLVISELIKSQGVFYLLGKLIDNQHAPFLLGLILLGLKTLFQAIKTWIDKVKQK